MNTDRRLLSFLGLGLAAFALHGCGLDGTSDLGDDRAGADQSGNPGADAGSSGAGGDRITCGSNTCATGEVCCNESCGICTPPDGACTMQLCEDSTEPGGVACGSNTCDVGEVCCNESCGICTPPDGACITLLCEPTGDACESDDDCHLVDDYCGGCNCLGLTDPSLAPECDDPVACFDAPCEGKSVACVGGACAVSP
jgi:hypothetical protein